MRENKKYLIAGIIILLLTAIIYVQSLNRISIARVGNQSGADATEDSKTVPVEEAKDWVDKVDEEGRRIVRHTWADTLENIFRNTGRAEQIADNGDIYIACEDYVNIYSLFCSAHGTPLPGWNSTIVRSGGLETSVTDQGKKTAFLTEEDINGATVFRNQTEWTEYTTDGPDNPFETTKSKTLGRFTNKGIIKATPAEAWVLAEMDKNLPGGGGDPLVETTGEEYTGDISEISSEVEIDGEHLYVAGAPGEEVYLKKEGDRYYVTKVTYPGGGSGSTSYVQYAWWKVKTVGIPSTTPVEDLDAGLAAEAEAFEQYIIDVTGNSDVHNLERNEDDTFKIDYKVSMTPENEDEISVRFNSETNKYIIGPYTITYLRACTQQAERPKVSFSGIDSTILVGTDENGKEVLDEDGKSILQLGKNYRFVYQDEAAHKEKQEGFGDTDEDYPYPYSDEEFYIEMDYLDDVVFLKNLKFDFQYMTANGSFELFEGDYLTITWEPMTDVRSRVSSSLGGGTANVTLNNTMLALNTGLSSRASEKANRKEDDRLNEFLAGNTKVREMKGEYNYKVDFDKVTAGDVENESLNNVDIQKNGSAQKVGNNIKYPVKVVLPNGSRYMSGGVEYQDYKINNISWSSETASGNEGNNTEFDIVIPIDDSKVFVEETITIKVSVSYQFKSTETGHNWIDARGIESTTCTGSTKIQYYNSILNNDGNVEVIGSDKIEIDNNKIYYKGFLDQNKVEITYNPLKKEFEQCRRYTQYVLTPSTYGGDNPLTFVTGTHGTFKIAKSGSGKVKLFVEANNKRTEEIVFDYEIPNMSIDEKDVTSVDCEATVEGTPFDLYNAFTDDLYITWNDSELPDKISILPNPEDGTVVVSRSGILTEDGSETATIIDGCGSPVNIEVSWIGSTIGRRNPIQTIGAGTEYSYRYYMVASEASSATAQTQINACGDHDRIDVTAENGLGTTVSGVPVELEFIHKPIDLRTSISGMVWIDNDEQKAESSGILGLYDGEDKPAPANSVEIVVWKVKYEVASGKEVERYLATAWNESKEQIDFVNKKVYIGEDGKYKIARIQVPAEEGLDGSKYVMSYDVEFIYDGQTYEVTEYLVPEGKEDKNTVKEKLEAFKRTADQTAGANKDYTEYAKSSYIVENADERYDFDKYFAEIYGYKAITDDGKTEGKATGGEGGSQYANTVRGESGKKEAELKYDSELVGEEGYQKRKSNLITHDENNFVYDQYKFAARTSEAGLLLPYERKYHTKEKYYDNYTFQGDAYKPIDEYFNQINLGLLERYHSDISVKKDLYTANVVVNGNSNVTKYNSLMPITDEALNLQVTPAYRQQTYRIDLYNSDYMYRSGAYNSITDELTKTIVKAIKDESELRLFVTYKLEFINESVYTDVSINEFVDYYDKSFTRVDEDITAQIEDQTATDDKPSRVEKTVAYAPYYRKLTEVGLPTAYNYNKAEDLNESLDDSGNLRNTVVNGDKLILDKTSKGGFATGSVKFKDEGEAGNYKVSSSTSLRGYDAQKFEPNEDLTLEPGEVLEVFVTYQVDREGYNIARQEESANEETRHNLLGEKNNIVELSNYSTFYTEEACKRHSTLSYSPKHVSGRVDQDSAPDNIDITKVTNSSDTKMLEDDTEFAPCVTVDVREPEDRKLDGVVWEDSRQNFGVGDGIYQDTEQGIKGIDVTMVEKIRVTKEDLPKIKEYTQEKYPDVFKDLKDLEILNHEFEYIWKSDVFDGFENEITSGDKGYYKFENFVSGTYVVRFEYGNEVNETDLKYNGQDYKNTSYQTAKDGSIRVNPTTVYAAGEEKDISLDTSDMKHLQGKATLNNEWHDLSSNDTAKSLEEDRVSDARDYEPQRLRTIAYSRTITNENAEVLASAIEKTQDITSEKAIEHVTEEYKNILNANQQTFVDNTRMVANTAKLFVDVEKQDTIAYKKVKTEAGDEIIKITDAKDNPNEKHEYYIKNIDFGLVERPETRINIRKEINAIQLLKNDGRELILGVKCDENGNIIKDSAQGNNTVRLEKISEINKESLGDGQGFKYIAMETKMLNGLQVKLTYRIEVINNSEIDYTTTLLADCKNINALYKYIDRFENTSEDKLYGEEGLEGTVPFNAGKAIIYGKFLGTYYYTNKYFDNTKQINEIYGAKDLDGTEYNKYETETVVKTTIDQLVDYIDNDLSINLEDVAYENTAWVGSSDADRKYKLSEVAYEKNADGKYDKDIKLLQDDKERAYVSKSNIDDKNVTKNNIYMSVNDIMTVDRAEIAYNVAEINPDKQPVMEINSVGLLVPKVGGRKYDAYTTVREDVNSSISDNSNGKLTTELVPEKYKESHTDTISTGEIYITTAAQASEEAIDNMNYDNLVEIAMYSNSVGRRDMQTIPGNANMIAKDNKAFLAGYIKAYNVGTKTYEFKTQTVKYTKDGENITVKTERDAYAARDTVTFSEPTGLSLARQKANKTIRILLASLIIAAIAVAVAIVITAVRRNKYDDNDILKTKN